MPPTAEQKRLYRNKWAENNRDSKNAHSKTYREKDNSKIVRRRLEEVHITCVCGAVVRKYGVKQHEKTKKHQKYIADNIPLCVECK